ncbi:sensor histidine kinase [Paenibacillus oryzisoli]|uniref:sensor histidine kinase n=1 Tax=Paenibacillus oryzisoli TaxID=1850517 RepID=UPI003D267011
MRDSLSLWFIVKNYRIRSVFIKNFFIILSLILLPVTGFSVGIYQLYSKTVTEEISSAHLHSLSRIRDMIDMTIREADNYSIRIASSETLATLMSPSPMHNYDLNVNVLKMSAELNMMDTMRNFVESVYVYSEQNRSVISSQMGRWDLEQFLDQGWLDSYNTNKSQRKAWTVARKAKTFQSESEEKTLITLFRLAPLLETSKLGSVIINIDTARFMNMINQTGSDYIDSVFIIGGDGTILGSNDLTLINRPISDVIPVKDIAEGKPNEPVFVYEDESKQSVSYVHSLYNDWKFVSIAPLKLYEDKAKYIRNYLYISSLFSIVVALIISLVVSWRMYMPIKQIMSVVSRPGEWLEESPPPKRVNEIKYITSSILDSYGEKRELENELRYRLSLLDRAYAIALQSQINPHFLYNTLETINWQAIRLSGGENVVSDMISSLSQLLRFSLEGEDNLVPIRVEIEHCKHYIDIQKIRYPRKVDVQWHLDEKIMNYKIPRITLQPLIENSIYHGIRPMSQEGMITISGQLEGDSIVIRVADNGVGADPDKIERINQELADKNWITANNHIGIRNVNQRIKLTFGDQYGLHMASVPGHGTTVTVRISAIQA